MDGVELNWPAVAVAAVVYFVLGAVWYSPLLFVERWMRARGTTREEIEANARPIAASLAVQAVGSLVSVAVLAAIVSWAGADDVLAGLVVGLLVAVGLLAADSMKRLAFESESVELNLINNGYTVVGFLLAGAILGAWQ